MLNGVTPSKRMDSVCNRSIGDQRDYPIVDGGIMMHFPFMIDFKTKKTYYNRS